MGCQGTLKLVVYGYITYFFSFKINGSSSLRRFLLLFLSLVAQSGLASEAPTLPHTLGGQKITNIDLGITSRDT